MPVYDAELVVKLHEATPSTCTPIMPISTTSFTSSAARLPHGAPDPGRGRSASRSCSSSSPAARVIPGALLAITPAPPLPSTCSSDCARPWTPGYDTGPAVKIHRRASSISNLKRCALRVEGFGDGSSVESPQPFTTTSTQRSRIDCLPSAATTSSTIRTSTTPSADLPHKAPRLPPVQASSAVQWDTAVHPSPRLRTGCPGQVASRLTYDKEFLAQWLCRKSSSLPSLDGPNLSVRHRRPRFGF